VRYQASPAWKPAGAAGVDNMRMPYSQPWFRQGQGALDACVKELREMRALVEVRTNERDQALNMAREANEMREAVKAECEELRKATEEGGAALAAEQAAAAAAAADADAARTECDELRTEMAQLASHKRAMERAAEEAAREMEAAKTALTELAKRQAHETAAARRAEAELAAATELAMRMEAERAAERAAVQAADERREEESKAADRARVVEVEAKRLRELRAATVMDDTRETVEKAIARGGGHSAGARAPAAASAAAAAGEPLLTKFNDPETIFSILEGGASGQAPHATLIRASWLRAKQPRFLPANKSDLPPEAIISASELRKIYRQTKTKPKLLPIISVLHPYSSPAAAESHPDEDGAIVGRVIEALDMRWDQFTRKRGTGADSGIADLGVFFDWCALPEPGIGRPRSQAAVDELGLWYAHELLTVWMMPESRDGETGRLSYSNGWSAFEYLLSTTFKSSSDLSGYMGPWPQLLDLSEELDFEHNERVHRPPPAEPLVLDRGHELGEVIFVEEGDRNERRMASTLYQKCLFEMLAGSTKLNFTKLGWADVELARLALVLPLCNVLTELHVASNFVGDKGIIALAESLPAMRVLETLNLTANEIGDPGASRLAGAFTDGALQMSLKSLMLGSNHIGDKGALTLAGAISGGALIGCKKLVLTGNPCTPASRKAVTKALKKNKAPGA
jgi:hypothetical protein